MEVNSKVLRTVVPYKAMLALLVDYLIIAGAVVLSLSSGAFWVYGLVVIVIGSRMRALENLLHVASHNQLCANKQLNRWVGLLFCALPLGSSFYAYRKSHMTHHRYLGDQETDPDYRRYKRLGLHQLPYQRERFFIILIRMLLLIDVPKYIWGTLSSVVYTKGIPVAEWAARGGSILGLVVVASYYNLWPLFLLYWAVPFLTSFQVIRFLAEMSEHGGLYHHHDQAEMTRNNICHPLLAWLLYPHGDSYHLVHHLYPAIPYYHLKRAHKKLMGNNHYKQLHHCHGLVFGRASSVTTYKEMFAMAQKIYKHSQS